MKKIIACILLITLFATLSACSGYAMSATTEADTTANTQQTPEVTVVPISVEYEDDDLTTGASSATTTTIELDDDTTTFNGNGVAVDGNIVTITSAGTYNISGTLNDGQLVVDTEDEETVVLVLDGVDITCATSAPIYIINAEKTVITLADGSENYVTDGASYVFADAETDEPNAAIFSKDDLTINGDGALTVNANYNNGIASKDDLKITGGNITVNAVNDGIKGKDSVAVLAGTLTVVAGSDGLQASNVEEADKGYIAIEGGTLNVTAGLDAIQAETSLLVSGGDLTLTSGSGQNSAADSTKGLKAGVDITITGGTFEIDADDDAIHSNDSLTIDDGVFLLTSGDDGIHAEYSLTINGGDINVLQSFEGLESALITTNDGNIRLVTSDDGLNATTGNGGGQADSSYFYINGGYVVVNAEGDGLDSNGTAVMTGGVVIVQGPTTSKNGPIDVNGEFVISGGFLISAGSAGMPEIPSTTSTQNSIAVAFDSALSGGTLIHVETVDGEEVLTYESPKAFQLFVFSSPELQTNTTYTVYVDGEATGTVTDGLYSDGRYTPGTQATSLAISSSVTTAGNFQSSGGGPGRSRP
ncbi:MAG: carbohydrate-binding domain-containing protein [Chloroflexota bacterium]|nr:carbohydrate-binding domain-containing protein [Chloroflexota bacterium]